VPLTGAKEVGGQTNGGCILPQAGEDNNVDTVLLDAGDAFRWSELNTITGDWV